MGTWTIMQLLVISCLVAMALAAAEPHGVYGVPALYNSYPNWPGVSGLGFSSTCYGCYGRKKRSADAEPHGLYAHHALPAYSVGGVSQLHAGGGHSFQHVALGHAVVPGSAYGIHQAHPGAGHSFQHVSRAHL